MVMKNTEQGYMIGSIYLPDELTVRISWLLPATTVPLAMVMHLLSGNSRDFPFFISESDFPGAERIVFTVGLAISGLIQMFFAYRMWYKMRDNNRPRMLFFTMLCGLFTGGNLFIMSFANMYDYLTLHVITASLVFQGGMVWAIMAHFAIISSNKSGKNLRIVGILLSIISYLIMSQAIVRAVKDLDSYGLEGDTIFTLDSIQYAIDIAAYAEYTLFIGLILSLYSFERDFTGYVNLAKE